MHRRALWRQAHLWLALLLGWVFALLGASGAVLVLRAPLLEWEVGAAALTLLDDFLLGEKAIQCRAPKDEVLLVERDAR